MNLSIIINIVLAVWVLLLLRRTGRTKSVKNIIGENLVKTIYQNITDMINLSEVIFEKYEDFEDYYLYSVFFNIKDEIEMIHRDPMDLSFKLELLEVVYEIFSNDEIKEALRDKFITLNNRNYDVSGYEEEIKVKLEKDNTVNNNVVSIFDKLDGFSTID